MAGSSQWQQWSVRGGSYLVVDGDLRVGVSSVEGLNLEQVALLRKLHHPEQHGGLCCQRLEVQLAARAQRQVSPSRSR